ncbi:MAG: hypothetical protein ACOH5I_15490 [Oligoflexus sp.]
MKLISRKKQSYRVSPHFDGYLRHYGRGHRLPVHYEDLLRFSDAITLYDRNGQDTLWKTVSYDPSERREIDEGLLQIYAYLRGDGERSTVQHLVVDRVDLCLYGNTRPFRIRISNTLNENFDYFYVKEADASRLYGLELEHILSPNRIAFMVFAETVVEEHIYGIPGDLFLERYLDSPTSNRVRIAKEFVKFNERCFYRLLGDMHAANFVVDITMDFEENFYRIRAIDFDQQSYEGRKKVYLPQFFPQNQIFVQLALEHLPKESIEQYRNEERALMRKRVVSSNFRLNRLLTCMKKDILSPFEHVRLLREELAEHYQDSSFLECRSMGEVLEMSLKQLRKPSHIIPAAH